MCVCINVCVYVCVCVRALTGYEIGPVSPPERC